MLALSRPDGKCLLPRLTEEVPASLLVPFRRSLVEARAAHPPANLCFRRAAVRGAPKTLQPLASREKSRAEETQASRETDHSPESLRTAILGRLETDLLNHRHLALKPCSKPQVSPRPSSQEPEESLPSGWEERPGLCELACRSKEDSLTLQKSLETCSSETLAKAAKGLLPSLARLLTHEFGSYVVQRILPRDAQFARRVEVHCRTHFLTLVLDEFGSRVMQTLVAQSPAFRGFALKALHSQAHLCYLHISPVFLISAAINSAESPAEFGYVRELVLRDTGRLLASKYFKRVIVSFLEKASTEDLDLLFHRLGISDLSTVLSDKYSTYLLLVFVQRAHRPTLDILGAGLRARLSSLLRSKFFKFLATSLLLAGNSPGLAGLHECLRGVALESIVGLAQTDKDYFRYFVYLLLASSLGADLSRLCPLLRSLGELCGVHSPLGSALNQMGRLHADPLPSTYVLTNSLCSRN